jgi:flagellar export protein FliJ
MKRFRFRLQSLVFLRELRETQTATVLAQKIEHQRRLEHELVQAQARSELARANLLQAEGKRFAPQDHSAALADFDRTVAQERSAEKALLAHTKILDQARLAWAEAGKELKSVNNLRGRAEERHFEEATRREQAEMDEAASRIAGASYSLPS